MQFATKLSNKRWKLSTSKIILGKNSDQPGNLEIDVNRLVETRLLVQANSGGGKSYLIRKLVEELSGKVQVVILDIEGEFASLREKFDFILAGKGGDIPCSPEHAGVLARKILELRTDLICDLYELPQHERIEFVKAFLDGMINVPKELWHPTVVVLDECHIFAPEKSKSESLSAVIDMGSRGRKRGFCLVAATQRLSKLHKDVAAECQNKLIGLANMDIDRKRSSEELGFSDKETTLSLRDLEPGEFFAVGPAIGRGVRKVRVGAVTTKHAESGLGRINIHTPAPTEKVKEQLAKLVNLPKEAEEEARDLQSMRIRIKKLEAELRRAPVPKIDEKAVEKAYTHGVEAGRKESAGQLKRNSKLIGDAYVIANRLNHLLESTPDAPRAPAKAPIVKSTITVPISRFSPRSALSGGSNEARSLGICERKILGFLSLKPGEFFTRSQVGAMSGYAPASGSFNNALSRLTQANLIERSSGSIALRKDADVSDLVVGCDNALQDWVNKLGKCERAIYEVLLANPHAEFAKEEIAEGTGYASASGSFNNSLSRLNTLGLMRRSKGNIMLNPELVGL